MAGLHVVTGRQWNNDNVNTGAIGNISRFKKEGDSIEIDVSWENGTSSHVTFPANLELLDTNALGISHPSTICDVCKEVNIRGFLWNCVTPNCNKSLCSKCYHADKHNLRHPFERVDISGSPGVQLGKRQNYTRVKLSGPKRYNGRPYYIDHLPSIWEWRDVNILQDRMFSEADPVYDIDHSVRGKGVTSTKKLDQNPEAHYENKEADTDRKSQQIVSENAYENSAANGVSSAYINDAASGKGHKGSSTPTDNPYTNDDVSSEGTNYEELTSKEAKSKTKSTPEPALIEEEVYDELEETSATKPGKAKEREKGSFIKKLLFKKKKEKNAAIEGTESIVNEEDYVVPISPGSDPDNIYDSLQDPPVPEGNKSALHKSTDPSTTVTIIQSYQPRAGNPDELTVRVGDVVRGVVRGEDGWLKGTLGGRTGFFPELTVQKTDDKKAPAAITQRALPAIPGQDKSQASKRASLPAIPTENRPKHQQKDSVAGGALATRKTVRTTPLPATPTERRISDDEPGPTLAEARHKFGGAAKVDKIERVKPKPTFNRADKVRITKTKDEVKKLQVGHGGWFDTIEEVLGKVGIVTDVHKTGDVFVKFDSLCTRLNPEVLSVGDAASSKPMRRPLSTQLQGRVNMMVNRESPDDNTY